MAQERKQKKFALKFWQKTYLLTLTLFLLALYGGIAAIASFAHRCAGASAWRFSYKPACIK